MRPVDNHSHILLSDIGVMLRRARRAGLAEYSITEHVSQFKEPRETVGFGSVHTRGRIFKSVKEYNEEFAKAQPESLGLKLNRGLEVDFSPRYEKRVGDFVNQDRWDILLCSIHEFAGGRSIERRAELTLKPTNAHQLWREYFELEHLALESDFVPFHVLSHPVRMSRGTRTVPPDFDDLLYELAKTARKQNKALELNGSDIEHAPDLVRRLAVACRKGSCSISLGSDAHHPGEVSRNISAGMRLVDELKLELVKI